MNMKRKKKILVAILFILGLTIFIMTNEVVKTKISNFLIVGDTLEQSVADVSAVSFSKTASWVDINNGIAQVQLKDVGNTATEPIDAVLIVDVSGSMGFGTLSASTYSTCYNTDHWVDGVHYINGTATSTYSESDGCISRMDITKSAINSFVNLFLDTNEENRIAIVTFSSTASTVLDFSSTDCSDKDAILNLVNNITSNVLGGTNYQSGFSQAQTVLNSRTDATRDTSIIFLTDGDTSTTRKLGKLGKWRKWRNWRN